MTVDEAEEFIREIRSDALRHNVYAYLPAVAPQNIRTTPQGAGRVSTHVLLDCVVVTRHFCGICPDRRRVRHNQSRGRAEIAVAVFQAYSELYFECSYSDYQRVLYELAGFGAIIDGAEYAESVKIRFAVKKADTDRVCETLLAVSAGRGRPEITGERYDSR